MSNPDHMEAVSKKAQITPGQVENIFRILKQLRSREVNGQNVTYLGCSRLDEPEFGDGIDVQLAWTEDDNYQHLKVTKGVSVDNAALRFAQNMEHGCPTDGSGLSYMGSAEVVVGELTLNKQTNEVIDANGDLEQVMKLVRQTEGQSDRGNLSCDM